SSLLFVLCIAPLAAQDNCTSEGTLTCSFSPTSGDMPAVTTGVFNFGSRGTLVVEFDTVLTNFTLSVDAALVSLSTLQSNLDPNEFPSGTRCVQYDVVTPGNCVQYNFMGTANPGGPFGLPVKNKDYKGLITLVLTYETLSSFVTRDPAFGHAPGDITIFTENILTSYFETPPSDPGMGGKTPGLSSVVALDEPLTENDAACPLTLTP